MATTHHTRNRAWQKEPPGYLLMLLTNACCPWHQAWSLGTPLPLEATLWDSARVHILRCVQGPTCPSSW